MSEYVFKTDSPVKTCGECPCFHAENPMYCQVDKNIKMTCPYAKRMENCPLKELPPHGDLGDISDLYANLMADIQTNKIENLQDVIRIINEKFDNAPVILKANYKEESK